MADHCQHNPECVPGEIPVENSSFENAQNRSTDAKKAFNRCFNPHLPVMPAPKQSKANYFSKIVYTTPKKTPLPCKYKGPIDKAETSISIPPQKRREIETLKKLAKQERERASLHPRLGGAQFFQQRLMDQQMADHFGYMPTFPNSFTSLLKSSPPNDQWDTSLTTRRKNEIEAIKKSAQIDRERACQFSTVGRARFVSQRLLDQEMHPMETCNRHFHPYRSVLPPPRQQNTYNVSNRFNTTRKKTPPSLNYKGPIDKAETSTPIPRKKRREVETLKKLAQLEREQTSQCPRSGGAGHFQQRLFDQQMADHFGYVPR